MKRYNDINRFLLIIFITTGFWITIETRQVDTQQILSAISGSQLSMEMLVSEMPLQEPVMNDCPVYCNSVSCRCDEEAYKERDKMDNKNPEKWIFIEDRGKENYFDWTKIK